MDRQPQLGQGISRRGFLSRSGAWLGSLALASMNDGCSPLAAASSVGLRIAPKAKRIIFLFQAGGPSQLDLFDPKPKLVELSGKPMPESLTKGQRVAQLQGRRLICVGSKFKFARHGEAGTWFSELVPHTAGIADKIAVVRSMHTEAINHDPGMTMLQTGHQLPGRPSMGAWLSYALGSENENLPEFLVLISGSRSGAQPLYARLWGSGFLPSNYQGVGLRTAVNPVLFLSNHPGVDRPGRRRLLDALRRINELRHGELKDPETLTRIAAYEMAYRLQTSVPELMEISKERPETLAMYGAEPGKPSFALNCLLARRLAERGVRFIQLYDRGWDHHANLPRRIVSKCKQVDQPAAALVKDLEQRGLLDETLVIWAGEFGRSPMNQGSMKYSNYGRDHHGKAFSIWMAGGGIKPGVTIGATDELGYDVIEDPIHVNDLHATVLHCLGIDHTKLTYKFQGRKFRLTDVGGVVVRKLLV